MKNSIIAFVAAIGAFAAVADGVSGTSWTFVSPKGEWSKETAKSGLKVAAFSKTIVNEGDVAKVQISAAALGCYELYVNGELVSSAEGENRFDYLRAGVTDPTLRRAYNTYDATGFWKKGKGAENVVSAFVAASWFSDTLGGRCDVKPAFAANVSATGADGKTVVFSSDATWFASFDTPFTTAGIYEGEIRDGRVCMCAAKCAGRETAEINTNFTGTVSAAEGPGVSLRRDIALLPKTAYTYNGAIGASSTNVFGQVRRVREFRAGDPMSVCRGERLVVDFGQNAAAIPEIVATSKAGAVLTFKGGEMLNDANGERARGNDGPAGSLYRENYRALKDKGAEVKYVFRGDGAEHYLPTFTFMGYRYAEISATDDVTIWSIRSIPVTSIRKSLERGAFRTSDRDVNRLVENVRWGQYSNYLSVPTDCPQRDERLGWTADTQVFTAAAYRNADVYGFLSKFMTDMRDSQSRDPKGCRFPGVAPSQRWGACGYGRLGWADAGVIVPWTSWKMTGDKSILEKNWDAMVRFVNFQQKTKYRTAESADGNYQWADWVSFEKYESCSGRGWKDKKLLPETLTYWDFLAGCYWLWNAQRMSEMSTALAKADESARFAKMADEARAYLKGEFFKDGGRLPEFLRDMQTPHLFALKFGLYDDPAVKAEAIDLLLKNIDAHNGCLQTGFLGTSILMDTLTYDAGRPDVAYSLLLQHAFPSWLYSVDQGATTIWERWNSYTRDKGFGPVGMNSFNHYAYGAVLDWLYGTVAGIKPGKNGGFDEEFVLAPIPDKRLGFVEASYKTKSGVIKSSWKYVNGACTYSFSIPAGSKAVVTFGGKTREYGPGSYTLK